MNSRQTMMAALKTQLETITTANGYNTNLGASIYEWRGYPADTSDMPLAIMRDNEHKVENGYHEHNHELSVDVEIIASGSSVVSEMRKMLADVYDALGGGITLGNCVYSIDYNGDSLVLVHEEQKIMSGTVALVLRFKSGAFDSDKIYNV